jgi:RNA recognition motif. (a.k.a. RRM, RBD, or RNP domain)
MNGFGFLEYEDAMDARDVVPGMAECDSRCHSLANAILQHSVYLTILPYFDPRTLTIRTDGSEMNGSRITVQFARGARHKENFSGPADRAAPRPRRTIYRMVVEGLAPETSWQDLKDFARDGSSVDVVYSETDRARDGKGFVEFETKEDLKAAVEKLDGRDYKGAPVVCRQDVRCDKLWNRNAC